MLFFKQNHNNTFLILLFISLLVLPAIVPLFHKGFFLSDDGGWMIIRFSAFFEALRNGQFPVRLLQRLNQGYGYPVADFLYPGFLYLGVPVHLVGFSFIDTIKMLIGTSMIGSVLFCYLWLRRFFKLLPSIIGSLFYGYAPYHLYDLYVRGSVGELLSLAVIPFVCWQIERKSIFWSSLGVAMLLLAHNTLSVFFFALILVYILFKVVGSENPREIFLRNLAICFFGISLATFFWLPAIYDLQFTVFSTTTISNWSSYFSDFSLVGILTYFVFTLTLILLLKKRVDPKSHRLTIVFLFIGLLSTFFATNSSTIFWNILPVSFVQFPFRFLSVTIFVGSFLSAFLFSQSSKKERIVLLAFFIALSLYSSWQILAGVTFTDKPDSYYATNLDTTTVHQEYMPKWVTKIPTAWQQEKVITTNGSVTKTTVTPNAIFFVTNGKRNAIYAVQKVYFPGWQIAIDGVNTQVDYHNSQGIMVVNVPKGLHTVSVLFKETPIRLFSDIISVISLMVLFSVGIFQMVRNKK